MSDFIVSLIIVIIMGAALLKIVSEKKKGSKCMGCPHSKSSEKRCGCQHE
ncbi:MAG TPA: FeoB-associated Cys-rich membrane protein [Firmicutes bacterium]|nr:FeoB-associated Cys-rich membrane protein [Bacillota bacterium]